MEFFYLIWGQVNIKDIVDIFLVSVLIYQLLRIVQGTRALQILMGLGVLMVLFIISLNFKFYSLHWLLQHIFDSFFIIAVVLFQDELKSALASVGGRKEVFGFFKRNEDSVEVDEIVEACRVLKKEKIGALLVVQRDQGLNDISRTGTPLNSKLHSDLLYAIFQSNSPLHDGAILIKEKEIIAAGCFLPLSKKVDLDRRLGTRHRAAMGVTERTDAVAIVISEETGNISLCLDGKLHLCDDPKKLRDYLKHLLSRSRLSGDLDDFEEKGSRV